MNPKKFIKEVLIPDIKNLVKKSPYLAFVLISIGIEFIGKCMIIEVNKWNFSQNENKKYKPFFKGVELMMKIDSRYELFNLKETNFRNSFVHSFLPPEKISLSQLEKIEKSKIRHLEKSRDITILIIENLYEDFIKICNIVLDYEFDVSNKVNNEFLDIKKIHF